MNIASSNGYIKQEPKPCDSCGERCDDCPHTDLEFELNKDEFLSDPMADADALASAGWGTDEDYGGYTDML